MKRKIKYLVILCILILTSNIYAEDITTKNVNNEVPYANPVGFEYEWDDDDNVKYEIYVTDYMQQEYQTFDKTDPFTYTLVWKLNGQKSERKNLKAGDHFIEFGKLPKGYYTLDFYVIDNLGRQSAEIFKEFRVIDKQEVLPAEQIYTMTKEDLNKYNLDNEYKKGDPVDTRNGLTTLQGLQRLLNEKKSEGYKKVIMYPGVYLLETVRDTGEKKTITYNGKPKEVPVYDVSKPLFIPTEFTLDLNNATLKQSPHGAESGLIVLMQDTFDSHLINGTVEGEWDEHDFTLNAHSSEWSNGVGIANGAKYCSIDNVKITNITGYGSTLGFESKYGSTSYTYFSPFGGGKLTGDMDVYGDVNDNRLISKNFVDLSNAIKSEVDFIQIGLYLGYQGNPTGDNWNYIAHFYDESYNEISKVQGYYYRKIKYPKNAKYIKLEVLKTESDTTNVNSEVCIFGFKTPVNCRLENVTHDNIRAVGCAPATNEGLIMRNCTFTKSGYNLAKCAFDAEDGWDMMQDMWLVGNTFKDNPYNELLLCAGHNTTIENNVANIYLYPRCKGTTIRNNNTNGKYIRYSSDGGSRGKLRTYPARIYNNNCFAEVINNKDEKEYRGLIDSRGIMVRDNVVATATIEYGQNLTLNCGMAQSVGEEEADIRDSKFYLKDFNGYLSSSTTYKNCTFDLYEPYKQEQIAAGKPLEYKISFNKIDSNMEFTDCIFKNKVWLADHNAFNNGKFTRCTFDDLRMNVNFNTDNMDILFKDCDMNSTADEFLVFGPHAYSSGAANITFENVTLTHTGNKLIHSKANPITSKSNITFKNCNITKETGVIIYRNPVNVTNETKLRINFENCIYSPYLETAKGELAEKYPDKIIITFENVPIQIDSNVYDNVSNKFLSSIVVGTTVEQLKSNIIATPSSTILTVYKEDGIEEVGNTERIKTGMILTAENGVNKVSYKLSVLGDVNKDGLSNDTDANIIKENIKEKTPPFEDYIFLAADNNIDKRVTIADVLKIYAGKGGSI